MKIHPAVASRPSGPAIGETSALAIASVTAPRASAAIGQVPGVAAHHLVKFVKARSKPLAWVSARATKPMVGLTAPSSTSARTFCGYSWA